MSGSINLLAAFGAGLISFLAPCTLALVPAYVSYATGSSFTAAAMAGRPSHTRLLAVVNAVLFSLGFTAVFVVLGASLGALSQSLHTLGPWLNQASGILLIAFGLVAVGLLRVPLLERGFVPRVAVGSSLRSAGAFLIGATFAFSWTPCVGPILGGILALAGNSGSARHGALLLSSYSAGIMVPFLAAGIATGWTSTLLRRYGSVLNTLSKVGGGVLILLGIAVFTNVLPILSGYLALGT